MTMNLSRLRKFVFIQTEFGDNESVGIVRKIQLIVEVL